MDNNMEVPSKTNNRTRGFLVSFIQDLELEKANNVEMPMGTDKFNNNKRLLPQPAKI